jgi:hypothetical protein
VKKRKIVHRPDPKKAEALRDQVKRSQEVLRPPQVGDVMPDGTIYAGISPDTHKKLFVMPRDDSISGSFNTVADRVEKANAQKILGHDDWRMPTRNELIMLYRNRDAGALKGTFNEMGSHDKSWYWGDPQKIDPRIAPQVCFKDGVDKNFTEYSQGSLRCVRD